MKTLEPSRRKEIIRLQEAFLYALGHVDEIESDYRMKIDEEEHGAESQGIALLQGR